MHGADAGKQQRIAGSRQGGTSGDHIINEQHSQLRATGAGTKRRTQQPLGTRLTSLRRSVAAVEQAPARHAKLGRHRSREQLGLVVPPRPGPHTAGGRPRDNVDLAHPQTANHEPRQLAGNRAPIAVLETVDHLARDTLKRQRCHDARLAELGRRAGEREAAAVAERGTGLIATGAEDGEDHGGISTRRV